MTNNKDIKVIIGVPVADNDAMRARTAQAIGGAIIGAHQAGIEVVDFVLRQSCDVVSNRTWIVNHAIQAGATHLLFADADMIFPYDTIPKLLAHGKEIVGVRYHKREFPLSWVYKPLANGAELEDSLFKVAHVGTGLLLIDLSIFEKLGKPSEEGGRPTPWFNFGRDSQGALAMGEDVWFCNVARDAGYDVWVDPTLKIGHIGEYIF